MRHARSFLTRPWLNSTSTSTSSSLWRRVHGAAGARCLTAWQHRLLLPGRALTSCARLYTSRHSPAVKYVPGPHASVMHAFVDCNPATVDQETIVVPDRADPAAWADVLERILPAHQRTHPSESTPLPADLTFARAVFWRARQQVDTGPSSDPSPLLWMVNNARRKAAVHLVGLLLNQIAQELPQPQYSPPSNIQWPECSMESTCLSPISLESLAFPACVTAEEIPDTTVAHHTLNEIWSFLGHLVINSADTEGVEAETLMSTAMLILGRIHNLGLLPDQTYSYCSHPLSTTTKRPPILHMVSSRILAALSDATWRDQQDDAIATSASLGMSLYQISKDVPGGRFRLKVRPLGAEIWLELILWCCIDGGHSTVAARLIRSLQTKHEDPWFATRWTSKTTGDLIDGRIDSERLKARHGGVVGLIEGYSREKPFVEVPLRTVSVEAVLALSEALINDMVLSASAEKDLVRSMDLLTSVICFLEPHDLPPSYFDYLAVRLIQTGVFNPEQAPVSLKDWTEHITRLKNLDIIDHVRPDPLSLSLANIGQNALAHVGLQHQALDALIQYGDVHNALQVFNDIQESSDSLKLRSLSHFLQSQILPDDGFFSSRPLLPRLEFIDSHGQLPIYKLAGFLNLITETSLFNLGRWLLYVDDIDGTAIPPSMYNQAAMTAALFRFAAKSKDFELFNQVHSATKARTLLLSVRELRALVDALMSFSRFSAATKVLGDLQMAQGGGIGLSNLAHTAALIITMQGVGDTGVPPSGAYEQVLGIFSRMMEGDFRTIRSDFTQAQSIIFTQQVSNIASVLAHVGDRDLRRIALKTLQRSRPGNSIFLPAPYLNIILSAVVDTQGSTAGRRMWELFCADPSTSIGANRLFAADDDAIHLETEFSDDLTAEDLSQDYFVPIIHASNNLLEDGNTALKLGGAIQDRFFPQLNTSSLSRFSNKLKTTPITKPNLSTLRLIIRAAAAEKDRKIALKADTSEQTSNLRWAAQTLRLLGMRRKDLALEFEAPLLTALLEAYDREPRLRLDLDTQTVDYIPFRAELDRRISSMFSHGRENVIEYV